MVPYLFLFVKFSVDLCEVERVLHGSTPAGATRHWGLHQRHVVAQHVCRYVLDRGRYIRRGYIWKQNGKTFNGHSKRYET